MNEMKYYLDKAKSDLEMTKNVLLDEIKIALKYNSSVQKGFSTDMVEDCLKYMKKILEAL